MFVARRRKNETQTAWEWRREQSFQRFLKRKDFDNDIADFYREPSMLNLQDGIGVYSRVVIHESV